VDDRLNGDGAGIALGVNDPVLGAHLLGVFTAIWALYYVANNSDGFLQVRAARAERMLGGACARVKRPTAGSGSPERALN
jgi:hypothetical protein